MPFTDLSDEADRVDINATLPVDKKTGDLEGITVKFDIDNLGAAPEVTDDANPQAVAQPLDDGLIRNAVYALLKEELTRLGLKVSIAASTDTFFSRIASMSSTSCIGLTFGIIYGSVEAVYSNERSDCL